MNKLYLHISVFSLIRIVLNTMHRMVYPFLSVFGRGLGIGLPGLSLAVTLRSVLGVIGPFLGTVADSHGRKAGMLLGLAIFTLGVSLVVVWPSYPAFVLALLLTMLGKYMFDPAMQAYLGDKVPYERRALAMAATEIGWSLSFILGIPLVAVLIDRRGWQAPFPFLALLGGLAFVVLAWMLPSDRSRHQATQGIGQNLLRVLACRPAIAGLAVSLLISASNETVNLIFGVWMEASFGLRIAALGLVAVVIGISELGGEVFAAAFTDSLGKPRAVGIGIILSALSGLALPFLSTSQAGATAGLFLFYICFEFTVVSSIPMMTEILPAARATLMAVNVACLSLGRSIGALLAPPLYTLGGGPAGQGGTAGILFCGLAAAALNLLALVALAKLNQGMQEQEKSGV